MIVLIGIAQNLPSCLKGSGARAKSHADFTLVSLLLHVASDSHGMMPSAG
ncbi:hypothetical protein [Sphingomonas sp. NFR04]|nr:hypothetical protein [Sphingomonas sp. NFR04]